jgi:CRISPR-associated Csx2 family protein
MGRKVLISSIGSGSYEPESKEAKYHSALYGFDGDERIVESAYIIDALKPFLEVDSLILVGTTGSQWHLFYKHLFDNPDLNGVIICPYDEDYFLELWQLYEERHKTEASLLEFRHKLDRLNETLRGFCLDIVILEYGLNDQEIAGNFILFSKAAELIKDGDSVIFDVTHSFRSLAFFGLVTVKYIKEVLGRDVALEFVSYGMFEARELNNGVTPIVDLSSLVKLMDYMKAAEEFERFGTATLLSELLLADDSHGHLAKSTMKSLRRLGSAGTYNDSDEFNNMVKNCNKGLSSLRGVRAEDLLIKRVLGRLVEFFGDAIDNKPLIMARLGKWHFEHKRYLESSIILHGFMLSHCAELLGQSFDNLSEWKSYELEQKILSKIRKKLKKLKKMPAITKDEELAQFKGFLQAYCHLVDLRNTLAHGKSLNKQQTVSFENAVNQFNNRFVKLFVDNTRIKKSMGELFNGEDTFWNLKEKTADEAVASD